MTVGDAISDHVLTLRRWLREQGLRSEIYAEHIDPRLTQEVRPVSAYRPSAGETLVIYHHSIGSTIVEQLLGLPVKLLLIYHNITPPAFVAQIDPALARHLQRGLEQLALLRPHTLLGLGVSPFNESELRAAGFEHTGVLPITFDAQNYALANSPLTLDHSPFTIANSAPLLLFVGRIMPHKRQEDLIKLLYYYRRIEPNARVALVGSPWLRSYERWLQDLAQSLDLADQVIFAGHVSQAEMVNYFRQAHLYVSMSEHEGFGKPLIESMYCGLPILAYSSAGVPSTLGDAGVLFHRKDFPLLAELVDLLVKDQTLRQRLIARQRARVQAFLEPQVKQLWQNYLAALALV